LEGASATNALITVLVEVDRQEGGRVAFIYQRFDDTPGGWQNTSLGLVSHSALSQNGQMLVMTQQLDNDHINFVIMNTSSTEIQTFAGPDLSGWDINAIEVDRNGRISIVVNTTSQDETTIAARVFDRSTTDPGTLVERPPYPQTTKLTFLGTVFSADGSAMLLVYLNQTSNEYLHMTVALETDIKSWQNYGFSVARDSERMRDSLQNVGPLFPFGLSGDGTVVSDGSSPSTDAFGLVNKCQFPGEVEFRISLVHDSVPDKTDWILGTARRYNNMTAFREILVQCVDCYNNPNVYAWTSIVEETICVPRLLSRCLAFWYHSESPSPVQGFATFINFNNTSTLFAHATGGSGLSLRPYASRHMLDGSEECAMNIECKNSDESPFVISLVTDRSASSIEWTVTTVSDDAVRTGERYPGAEYRWDDVCLRVTMCYEVRVQMMGTDGIGSYLAYYDGQQLLQGELRPEQDKFIVSATFGDC